MDESQNIHQLIYIHGVDDFLDKAFERAFQGNEILYPCKKCFNRNWHCRNMVEDHLICHGFVHGYTKWVFHGEGFFSRNTPHPTDEEETSNRHDDIDRLLHDTFRNVVDVQRHEVVTEGPYEDAKIFLKLVEEGKKYLFLLCMNFPKLSFTIWLYLLNAFTSQLM